MNYWWMDGLMQKQMKKTAQLICRIEKNEILITKAIWMRDIWIKDVIQILEKENTRIIEVLLFLLL